MGKLYAKKTDGTPVSVDTPSIEEPVKEKKPRTEKQLAALEKAKQARAAKKTGKEEESKKLNEELVKKEEELKAAEEALAAKKTAAAEKRRLKREQKKQEQTPAPSEAGTEEIPKKKRKVRAPKEEPEQADTEAEPEQKKPKRQRVPKIVDPDQPPKWFVGFMEQAKREQVAQSGEKKSMTEIKNEVKDQASKTWNDGYTRDRIQSAQDKHLDNMYSMMFNKRKM